MIDLKYTTQLSNKKPGDKIHVRGREIIKVGDRIIPYPRDTIENRTSDYKILTEDTPYVPKKGDKWLDIKLLFPTIIFNFRDDAFGVANRAKLTEKEITYFKAQGNNATIFIHGFNVPYGTYGCQVESVEASGEPIVPPDIYFNTSPRTIYRDLDMLNTVFPGINEYPDALPYDLRKGDDSSNDRINGSNAHNWFVHIEDNLNRATGQFDRTNYMKYQRVIHIAWSGDVGVKQYSQSEDKANEAGIKLVTILKQLIDHGIEVNIIAHSMGNRVLLTALNELVNAKDPKNKDYQHYHEKINQVFMWEAAVSSTAFSDRADLDKSYKYNQHFIYAANAVKKITVLGTRYDDVLMAPYWIATYLGESFVPIIRAAESWITPHIMTFGASESQVKSMQEKAVPLQDKLASAYPHRKKELERLFNDIRFHYMLTNWSEAKLTPRQEDKQEHYNKCLTALTELAVKYNTPLAMGLEGIDANTAVKFGNAYNFANLTPWAMGHSYMREPDSDI